MHRFINFHLHSFLNVKMFLQYTSVSVCSSVCLSVCRFKIALKSSFWSESIPCHVMLENSYQLYMR